MENIVEYHRLRPYQLVKRRTEMPVAYIGLGILEWHGLHNPLGLDGVKAHGIACYLASKLGGVAMPPQFWGDNRNEICELVFDPEVSPWLPEGTDDHTISICRAMALDKKAFIQDAERSKKNGGWLLWEKLMVHTFFQIETLGFKLIIPIPGHYPLFQPLDRAIEHYVQNGGKCTIFQIRDSLYIDNGKPGGDHAAKFETSLMLALYPELVDLNSLDKDLTKPNVGVLGDDPRIYATKELGFDILNFFEDVVRKFIEQNI